MKVLPSRQFRQCSLHCKAYVRRYHSCREHLYRMWIYWHEKVNRCSGAVVQQQFQLDPFANTLFLFCGRNRKRMKALLWEGDGFVQLYNRLENGSFKWPRNESELKPITWQQFRWLMEGLPIEQKQSIKPAQKSNFLLVTDVAKAIGFTKFPAFLWYNDCIKNQRNYTIYERKRCLYWAYWAPWKYHKRLLTLFLGLTMTDTRKSWPLKLVRMKAPSTGSLSWTDWRTGEWKISWSSVRMAWPG